MPNISLYHFEYLLIPKKVEFFDHSNDLKNHDDNDDYDDDYDILDN